MSVADSVAGPAVIVRPSDNAVLYANAMASTVLGLKEGERVNLADYGGALRQATLQDGSEGLVDEPFEATVRVEIGGSRHLKASVWPMEYGDQPARLIVFQSRASSSSWRALSMVSHELHGPLAVISGLARRVSANENENLTLRQITYLSLILRNCERMARIVNDLQTTTLLEHGALTLERSGFDLAELLEELHAGFSTVAEEKGQEIEFCVDRANMPLFADRVRLSQAVDNLLTNASKYSPAGATIRLRACAADGCVRISVEDDGPGIPADEQTRLLAPFTRGEDHSTSTAAGLGLGLSVAGHIAELHGGGISIDSPEGEGTKVVLSLPLCQSTER
ncbi:MAG: sensor histidine kinase [Chloroflexota bacterium]